MTEVPAQPADIHSRTGGRSAHLQGVVRARPAGADRRHVLARLSSGAARVRSGAGRVQRRGRPLRHPRVHAAVPGPAGWEPRRRGTCGCRRDALPHPRPRDLAAAVLHRRGRRGAGAVERHRQAARALRPRGGDHGSPRLRRPARGRLGLGDSRAARADPGARRARSHEDDRAGVHRRRDGRRCRRAALRRPLSRVGQGGRRPGARRHRRVGPAPAVRGAVVDRLAPRVAGGRADRRSGAAS